MPASSSTLCFIIWQTVVTTESVYIINMTLNRTWKFINVFPVIAVSQNTQLFASSPFAGCKCDLFHAEGIFAPAGNIYDYNKYQFELKQTLYFACICMSKVFYIYH